MARFPRFEEHRYVATRDDMRVYDTDDDAQSEQLSERIAAEDLFDRKQLQSFGPDSLPEARNRGFRAV
ncbi:MAG: hypothetical protein M3112_08005 [Actinomycetia bacterium]|nr:hypothetical protein [Actinomycetes bacterium]